MTSYFRSQLESSLHGNVSRQMLNDSLRLDIVEERQHFVKQLTTSVSDINNPALWGGKDPWEHQKTMMVNTLTHFSNPEKAPIAIKIVPTGAGKTEEFTALIDALAEPVGNTQKRQTPPAIILVPSEDLIHQTRKRIKKQIPNLEVGAYYSKEKNIQPLTIMTYESFRLMAEKGDITPDDVKYLFMDEAHRGLSEMRRQVLEPFIRARTNILAYTASPVFDVMKNVYQLLGKENVVANIPIKELIAAKVLAPINNYIVKVNVEFDHKTLQALKEKPDLKKRIIERCQYQAAYDFMMKKSTEDGAEPLYGKPTLGFVNTIRQSEDATTFFKEKISEKMERDPAMAAAFSRYTKKHRVASLTSKNEKDRLEIIERLRNGKTSIAFNVNMLGEGTDIIPIANILKVTNTSSLVEELQEGGRATRTDPNNPSKVANVVNFPLYINGKLQGNPCFYFEAIGKPEFVKGVVDVNVDFDRLLQHSLDDGTKRELKQALDEEAKKQPHADKNERRPKYKEGENTRKDAAHQGKLIEIKVPENSVVKSGTENGNGNGVRYTYKTELEKVQHIIAQRDGTLLPIKQAEWLSINEMASRLGISGDRKDIKLLYNILSAHYDEYQRHDGQELLVSVTLAGKETTLRLCRQKPSGASPTVFVVHESAESDFRQALPGQLMPLPEDWLFGARGIAEAMGTSHMGEKFKQALTNLQKAVREGQSVEVGDAPIQAQFGYRNEQTVTFGIAPESLESFSKYSGIPLLEPLPDDWIKGRGAIANAIAKISKVTADDVALNNGITALYQKLHEGEELPEAVRASLRLGRSNNIRTFGIAPNAVENIAALLGIEVIGKIPDHYVAGKNPIAQAMGISPGGKAYGERYDALVKELEAGNPIIVDGITLNITRAIDGRTQMNTGVALEHIPLLAKHMGIPMKAVPTEIQNPVGEEVSPKNRTRFK